MFLKFQLFLLLAGGLFSSETFFRLGKYQEHLVRRDRVSGNNLFLVDPHCGHICGVCICVKRKDYINTELHC